MRSSHISYRSGNPALSSKIFDNAQRKNSGPFIKDDVMTIKGTVDKTALSLLLMVMAGYFTFNEGSTVLMVLGGVGGFIVALVTIFKKECAPITVPLYAMLEGLLLG